MAGRYLIPTAGREDVADILRLVREPAAMEIIKRPEEQIVSAGELEENISTLYHGLLVEYRAAEDSVPAVIGCLLWHYGLNTFHGRYAEMSVLYVSSDHRGRGCGTSLMQNFAKICRGKGCRALQWNVYGWNVRAKKLYDRVKAENWTETIDLQTMCLHPKDLAILSQGKPKIGLI